ncbi:ricin-type beta-trefoil lectin domain protein [Micromonospora avicenniae]|uniref:ricin-type beta-trefoil lectin domain protein n=1 Tax=Micromonospora avicenniae TaxID=1198245 RepID=UPI0034387548
MRPTPGAGGSSKLRSLLTDVSRRARRGLTPQSPAGRVLRGGWARLDTPVRRGIAAGAVFALAAAAGVAAVSGFGAATADDMRTGRPVPASQVQTISAAALACPALTPARLAGQVMAASGFDPAARTEGGGTGVAGLTDAVWDEWKPGADARREDPAANIVALAHYMCDLAGQVRQTEPNGDRWQLALAAYRSGLSAVRDAGGVPDEAEPYVGEVAGYATWYARQPEFTQSNATRSPGPVGGVEPSTGTPATPVPDAYLPAILAAGKACPAVPSTRVAAQLMAASAFNPNLFGSNGAQGIAQFNPEVWARYAPNAAAASPWDPHQAIGALGAVMCRLVREMGQVGQGDAYQKALAAFQWGPEAVQRAGGVPDSPAVRRFIALTEAYTTSYQRDSRLPGPRPTAPVGGPSRSPAGPGGAGTPSRPAQGGPAPGGPATGGPAQTGGTKSAAPPPPATPKPHTTSTAPANPGPQPVSGAGPIIGYGSDRCIDVTDGAYTSNPQLQIWTCNGGPNQRWTLYSDGTVRAFGRCMTVAGGSTANGAKILLSGCTGSSAQKFNLNQAHDLVNTRADKCVDAKDMQTSSGTRLQLWDCGGTSNQKWHR